MAAKKRSKKKPGKRKNACAVKLGRAGGLVSQANRKIRKGFADLGIKF